ncbi:MAG: hypothetical protein ACW97X_13970, partial [Candidatus Hodarchaeales archaeon]
MPKLDPESNEARKMMVKEIRGYLSYEKQNNRKFTEEALRDYLETRLSTCSDDVKKIQEAALM